MAGGALDALLVSATIAGMPASHAARYIWTDDHGKGRNRYCLFRKVLEIVGEPEAGEINLFADARYRLIVNGHVVGHGPCRFFPHAPQYDTHDLRPFLRRGKNVIAVLVNSAGAVTFHSEVSIGGLITWGDVTDVDGRSVPFASDDTWKATESPGHRSDSHYLSFALNAAESLDAREMPQGWDTPEFDDDRWPAAKIIGNSSNWWDLRPRSIPLLDERAVRPRQFLGAWATHPRPEQVHSLIVIASNGKSLHTRARVAVMTYIHSPRDQQVTLTAWWGKYHLNGQEMQTVRQSGHTLRQGWIGEFKAGWNTLVVTERFGVDWWDFYLALPDEAGLEISAEREVGSPNSFLVAGPWEDDLYGVAEKLDGATLTSPDALPEQLGPWKKWPRNRSAGIPLRERMWRQLERISGREDPAPPVATLAKRIRKDDGLILLFDFGGEVLGRPTIDFTAAPGTTIDFTYTERLQEDGLSQPNIRWAVDMAERYTAREGRQTWQTFHPRGFRYLEVIITGNVNQFDLHDLRVSRANYPVEPIGQFECSDPELNDIWLLGQRTQHACMEDAFLDCPWRERGLYTGDLLVQYFVNLATFGDHKLFRRSIELFLEAQGKNGLIPGGCHGLPPGRHPDYSCCIALALTAYHARTGDLEFLREMRPRFTKLQAGLEALFQGQPLLDSVELDPYLDSAYMDRDGVNCALNCFMQASFAHGARVFELLGDASLATHYKNVAERLMKEIRRSFWDADRKCFTDRRKSDKPDTQPSVQANVLPLLWEIADRSQVEGAIAFITAALSDNFRGQENPRQTEDVNCSPYFSFYALDVLYKHGRVLEAQEYMRRYWGWMLNNGAFACWEFFNQGHSLCHAWSACPTYYLSSKVLGVDFPDPADPNLVEIRPHPGTVQWARGVYPHVKGDIRVSWKRVGDVYSIDVEAPADVRVITTAPR